ncbi:MAG: DUF362 domain-containing protein [Proteobacteria bacterium]|nr:DUF362 domain-containing protein [Pseudomonadota bacterium]
MEDSRREFIKKSLTYGAAAGGTLVFGGIDNLLASVASGEGKPDLVAVKNGEPDIMFDRAIEAMGGMKHYVKPGQTVVVKPNIGWEREPETGANTNPQLVKRVIEQCLAAKAKTVYVFDNSVDHGPSCYRISGIESIAREAGAMVVPGHISKYFRETTIPGGKTLKSTKVHELILDSDVYINVPVLKHHASSGLTMALKNQMGTVKSMFYFHLKGLHNCISEIGLHRKPDLNIMDAYRVTMANGPQRAKAEDVSLKKSLLLSEDIVAIDAAGARMFGVAPESVDHIKQAHKLGLGQIDLKKIKIKKIYL